ncbi:hypothetical protein PQO03_14135 [Lentisphaera profundi]|uniref:Lipoprotein n=1 Tax=Lentisphaera profundi TaxID=1658616 RepID=A0ABY7VXL5_9BACT|nr:hypothetical protein [Lentisphaera profundi]WDE98975.1 hypothetical protein PQO03_14135 [Lentisphaera profundi]
MKRTLQTLMILASVILCLTACKQEVQDMRLPTKEKPYTTSEKELCEELSPDDHELFLSYLSRRVFGSSLSAKNVGEAIEIERQSRLHKNESKQENKKDTGLKVEDNDRK